MFYRRALLEDPKLIATRPYSLDLIRGWDKRLDLSGDLSGDELLLVAVFG